MKILRCFVGSINTVLGWCLGALSSNQNYHGTFVPNLSFLLSLSSALLEQKQWLQWLRPVQDARLHPLLLKSEPKALSGIASRAGHSCEQTRGSESSRATGEEPLVISIAAGCRRTALHSERGCWGQACTPNKASYSDKTKAVTQTCREGLEVVGLQRFWAEVNAPRHTWKQHQVFLPSRALLPSCFSQSAVIWRAISCPLLMHYTSSQEQRTR